MHEEYSPEASGMDEMYNTIDRKAYMNQWILVCRGKIIKHGKRIEDVLGVHENHEGDCHIEKVVEGQACFF